MNQTKDIVLFDHRGDPIQNVGEMLSEQALKKAAEGIARTWSSYISALSNLDQVPMKRARDPFGNHVWVYAAIMAIAVNVGQVPYVIYREDPDNPATKRLVRRTPQTGIRRRAQQKYLEQNQRRWGLKMRGLVPDYDHPLYENFYKPNPLMSPSHLWEATAMWMSLRGACFWLKMRRDGQFTAPGERPSALWPMNPDFFTPVVEDGMFLGWEVNAPWDDPSGVYKEYKTLVEPHEVVWFRYLNPADPLGWVSPITAAASGIAMDIAAMTYNRAVLQNGAKPGGLLLHEDDVDEDEEKKLRKYWKDRYEGPQNANKMAILTGNFKYVDIGLGPRDMEYLEQRKWDREEIFGALRVSKSVMSLSEGLNYATQLSQDKNFWDKCLMPLMRMFEQVLDSTLFYTEPDDVVGAFDFSKVEALRAGMQEQVLTAEKLCGRFLHMPPKLAFEIVGLEVPAYPGSDVCVVERSLVPIESVLDGSTLTATGGKSDVTDPKDVPDDQQPRPSTEK